MNRRDFVVGGTFLATGMATGVAVAPRTKCAAFGTPLEEFHEYLCAFHVGKKDPKFQVEAHHYCMMLNDDLYQCLVFADNKPWSKLLGIEYVITKRLYDTLDLKEKELWHPHSYEVESGLLVAPKYDGSQDYRTRMDGDSLMSKLKTTYGKTFHTWPNPKTEVPLGEAMLMWAAEKDDDIDKSLILARDKKLNINTEAIRRRRKY